MVLFCYQGMTCYLLQPGKCFRISRRFYINVFVLEFTSGKLRKKEILRRLQKIQDPNSQLQLWHHNEIHTFDETYQSHFCLCKIMNQQWQNLQADDISASGYVHSVSSSQIAIFDENERFNEDHEGLQFFRKTMHSCIGNRIVIDGVELMISWEYLNVHTIAYPMPHFRSHWLVSWIRVWSLSL